MRGSSSRLLVIAALVLGCREVSTENVSSVRPSAGVATSESAPAPRSSPPSLPSASPGLTDAEVGQVLVLRARHESGVPLHAKPQSGAVSARLADGSTVRVESLMKGGGWLEVSQGPVRGFITRRYVELPGATKPGAAARDGQASSPFASREACLRALARGERASRPPGVVRIGSWNLHWFPDGKPGKGRTTEGAAGAGADVEWLACVIAYLDFDALAAQELKATPGAQAKLAMLRAHLDRLAQGSWQAELDACPEPAVQHVGVLYDSKRAVRLGSGTLATLNPHGKPCQDQLRPGHGAYLRFRGGLDLHLISAHLKAGDERRSYELRKRSFAQFSETHDAAQAFFKDQDVLIAGDLNTAGCAECSPGLSGEQELASLDAALASERFRRLPSDLGCTYFYRDGGTVLDGVAASTGFLEMGEQARVHVAGLCAELRCKPPRGRHPAREQLSDHCPIYVDVPDHDRD